MCWVWNWIDVNFSFQSVSTHSIGKFGAFWVKFLNELKMFGAGFRIELNLTEPKGFNWNSATGLVESTVIANINMRYS